ncbi:hypothetical protein RRF57_001274 [Xylaria bambusicola]|uniref:Uncharacterized protein n=1 Tax=Xylaria bambusicola TaxID=326684 RepID=A0AAN7UBM0_9PEZI
MATLNVAFTRGYDYISRRFWDLASAHGYCIVSILHWVAFKHQDDIKFFRGGVDNTAIDFLKNKGILTGSNSLLKAEIATSFCGSYTLNDDYRLFNYPAEIAYRIWKL